MHLLLLTLGCVADPLDARPDDSPSDSPSPEDSAPPEGQADCELGSRVELTHALAWTQGLPWPLSGASPSTHFLGIDPAPLEPGERLYFYADYDMAGHSFNEQFEFFLWGLDRATCTLSATMDLVDQPLVARDLYDMSGEAPVGIPQAPLGGQGSGREDLGVNVWDVTDLDPLDTDCAESVAASTDYSSGGAPTLVWRYHGYGATVREFRLYKGREVDCP
ncbi:MAG: hypothetical protein H6741_11655 [Alphaproteobacteria bacterium]|nr:hypothetical protein [Alphaproteobacteria bacterium]